MSDHLPSGFVVLTDICHNLKIDLKYATDDNIIGRPLEGYYSDSSPILTKESAHSICEIVDFLQTPAVKKQLNMENPTLLIWDLYRPQMASEDFWHWAHSDSEKTKAAFYPNINKKDFFELGYIARQSSHSRGSTVDLTIIDADTNRALDMGTPFDYMDILSQPLNKEVSTQVFENRQFLQKLMQDFGWKGITAEWWHFTFVNEPFPQTYFNFPVLNYKDHKK